MSNLSRDTIEMIRDRRDYLLANEYHYSAEVLRIKQKAGGDHVRFVWNKAQRALMHFHAKMMHETGKVRLFVPKSRQLGISTLTQGHFFKKTSTNMGMRTVVMAHRDDSTNEIFQMVKDMHQAAGEFAVCDEMRFDPALGATNRQELVFSALKSGYRVSTAAASEYGRGMNFQNVHGSEVALWRNEAELAAGLMQTLPNLPGTEAIMESTGKGPNGWFYAGVKRCITENNTGEWRAFFLPWTWGAEYVLPVPAGWMPPPEILEYSETHKLSREQTRWMYVKNVELALMNGTDPDKICWVFRQEYPIHILECFQSPTQHSFFSGDAAMRARNSTPYPLIGAPTVLGIDAAGRGRDSVFMIDRQGGCLGNKIFYEEKRNLTSQAMADVVISKAIAAGVDAINVDCTGGYGDGLVDQLMLKLPENVIVTRVIFNEGAFDKKSYGNKRAEMHDLFRIWLGCEGATQVSIPNNDDLYSQIMAYEWGSGLCRRDDANRLFMEPKEKIREKLDGSSPDILDASVLTTLYTDHDLLWRLEHEHGE